MSWKYREDARRLASAINRRIPTTMPLRIRKALVASINDDGTVDLVIPPTPDPGDGSGEAYPRMQKLGSYSAPIVGDSVSFLDQGHGRYLCLGVGVGGGGTNQQAQPKINYLPYQAELIFRNAVAGSLSQPWYPRRTTAVTTSRGRIAVSALSIADLAVSVRMNGDEVCVMTLPAGKMTKAFAIETQLNDGDCLLGVVLSAGADVAIASVIVDLEAI